MIGLRRGLGFKSGGFAGVEFIAHTVATTTVDNEDLTPALPAGTQAGDLVVGAVYQHGQRGVTTPPGFVTYSRWEQNAATGAAVSLHARVYDGIWTAPIWPTAAGLAVVSLTTFRLAGGTPRIGARAANSAGSSSTANWAALNTLVDDDTSLVLRAGGNNGFSPAHSPPSPTTGHTVLHSLQADHVGTSSDGHGFAFLAADRSDPALFQPTIFTSGRVMVTVQAEVAALPLDMSPILATSGRAASATGVFPAGVATGDLLIGIAAKTNTIPGLPAGWNNIRVTTDFGTQELRAAWRVYSGFAEPTWTSATGVTYLLVRAGDFNAASPIGATGLSEVINATSYTWAALDTLHDDNSSRVVRHVFFNVTDDERENVAVPAGHDLLEGLHSEAADENQITLSVQQRTNPAAATVVADAGANVESTTLQFEIRTQAFSEPVFRSASTGGGAASVTHTIAYPTGWQPGDVLLLAATASSANSFNDPSGFTRIREGQVTGTLNDRAVIWRRVAQAGDTPTVDVTQVGSLSTARALVMLDYVDPKGTAIDVDAGNNQAAGLTHTAPTVTPTRVGRRISFFCFPAVGVTNDVVPAATTLRVRHQPTTKTIAVVEDNALTAVGVATGTRTMTRALTNASSVTFTVVI